LRLSIILFAVCAFGGEPFITIKEYGKALYNSYDNLSCAACHGEKAEGKILARYERNQKIETIAAPSLKQYSAEDLKKGLAKHGFGPPFYPSDTELDALETYLMNE
jgi:mono/diheme cytochrome c family protein